MNKSLLNIYLSLVLYTYTKFLFKRYNMAERKVGRPKKNDSEKRTNQIMLTFTDSEYEDIKKMKLIFNQPTLADTLRHFIQKGREALAHELAQVQHN